MFEFGRYSGFWVDGCASRQGRISPMSALRLSSGTIALVRELKELHRHFSEVDLVNKSVSTFGVYVLFYCCCFCVLLLLLLMPARVRHLSSVWRTWTMSPPRRL